MEGILENVFRFSATFFGIWWTQLSYSIQFHCMLGSGNTFFILQAHIHIRPLSSLRFTSMLFFIVIINTYIGYILVYESDNSNCQYYTFE